MKKTEKNLILLNMVFVVSLIVANVVTSKTIPLGISLFGTEITIPGAALCYAITFLMTDVIGEIWGKKEANRTVIFGFICQCLATGLIMLTGLLPAADPLKQASYDNILGTSWVFFIGSMVAYFASQSWDVYVFHKIRDRFSANPKYRWVWNNGSTMTSQLIDTAVFITISFGFGFGWIWSAETRPMLYAMLVGQYCIKFLLAALDTPVFYFLTRNRAKHELAGE